MRLCRVTCLASAGVRLEDMSVHLAGRGSSALVSQDVAAASKDLKRLSNLVSVEEIPEVRPMPVWPFVKSSSPSAGLSPALVTEIPVTRAEYEALMVHMKDVGAGVKALLLRSSSPGTGPGPTGRPFDAPTVASAREPVFIPSQIVQQVPGARVKVKEGEVAKDDFDSAKDALQKLRKK